MYFFDLLALCCFGLFLVIFIAFIYYLFILKEKGQARYKKFQDFFNDLGGTTKTKKKVKSTPGESSKPDVEDAEFREVK